MIHRSNQSGSDATARIWAGRDGYLSGEPSEVYLRALERGLRLWVDEASGEIAKRWPHSGEPPAGPSASLSEALTGKEGLEAAAHEWEELRQYKAGAQAAWRATADGRCNGCGGARNWSVNSQVQAYCAACDEAFEGTRKPEARPALEAIVGGLREKAAAEDTREIASEQPRAAPVNPSPAGPKDLERDAP